MPDRISRYRVVRLSIHLPADGTGQGRYAVIANKITRGVPSGVILADGVLQGCNASPTTEECLEYLDAAVRQHLLR